MASNEKSGKPELIVMLTHHDETVQNALELFESLKTARVQCWGFKDVGLPPEKMKEVVEAMRAAGKTTYLEVVSLSEEEGLRGAKLAVELEFDVLMGTVYYPSIMAYLKGKPIKYYPFPGKIYGHPSILEGTSDEIVSHAKFLQQEGAQGMDLLTYRYTGDAPRLLREVVRATSVPIVSAGSIATYDRIIEVWQAGAWGFTIGSAFFESTFVENGTFADNLYVVTDWLQRQ
jgi:hypothetical protein